MGSDVLTVPPGTVSFFTPSAQTNMFVTAAAESVVAATIETGEVTVAFRAGVQMVTDGSALLGVQGEYCPNGRIGYLVLRADEVGVLPR